jgi:hypothetical protein
MVSVVSILTATADLALELILCIVRVVPDAIHDHTRQKQRDQVSHNFAHRHECERHRDGVARASRPLQAERPLAVDVVTERQVEHLRRLIQPLSSQSTDQFERLHQSVNGAAQQKTARRQPGSLDQTGNQRGN